MSMYPSIRMYPSILPKTESSLCFGISLVCPPSLSSLSLFQADPWRRPCGTRERHGRAQPQRPATTAAHLPSAATARRLQRTPPDAASPRAATERDGWPRSSTWQRRAAEVSSAVETRSNSRSLGGPLKQKQNRSLTPDHTQAGHDHNPWLGTLACLGPYALAPLSRLMYIMEGTHLAMCAPCAHGESKPFIEPRLHFESGFSLS